MVPQMAAFMALSAVVFMVFFLFVLSLVISSARIEGGIRGDGIPPVEKKYKKHPICKTTVSP